MGLFGRTKTKEELEEDIDLAASKKQAFRQAETVQELAQRLLEEATKLTRELKKNDGPTTC